MILNTVKNEIVLLSPYFEALGSPLRSSWPIKTHSQCTKSAFSLPLHCWHIDIWCGYNCLESGSNCWRMKEAKMIKLHLPTALGGSTMDRSVKILLLGKFLTCFATFHHLVNQHYLRCSHKTSLLVSSSLLFKVIENGWSSMKVDESDDSGWKWSQWIKVDEKSWKWTKVDGNRYKWIKCMKLDKSG